MIPTAEQLDEWFKAGAMKRLGMGSRRTCYAIPNTNLCVKCYRSEEEIAEGLYPGQSPVTPLAATVVREINKCRFNERRNTSCREYRYWLSLKSRLPAELMRTFPASMNSLLLPSRGWCVVEELIAHADGSPAQLFADAWRAEDSAAARCRLLEKFRCLADGLVRHAVRFFDPQNVLVQRCEDGDVRLRITDFEPTSRAAVPLEMLLPLFARLKLRRRFDRYFRILGVH